jgi:nucleotide-binding universal stress UspA family protein
MPKVERILCPVDFSEFSARAYRYSLSLAGHYRATLYVQHVAEIWRDPSVGYAASGGPVEEFVRAFRRNAEEQLQEFVKDETRGEIQPVQLVEVGMAPDCILAFAQVQQISLIVMGTHGRRGFDRLMLGSVTERVMRKAPCAVLVVRTPSHAFISPSGGRDPVHLRRILFCTDFSENSQRALEHAGSLSAEYDAELTLLHVLEETPALVDLEEEEATALRRLDEMISTNEREAGKIKPIVRKGRAYEQIIHLASEMQADVVVMAVRGRSTIDLAVFGSTSYRVMQLGPSPVLAVHV